jgi:hypothetical protein
VEGDDDVAGQELLDAALLLLGDGVDVGRDAADLPGQRKGLVIGLRFEILEGLVAIVGLHGDSASPMGFIGKLSLKVSAYGALFVAVTRFHHPISMRISLLRDLLVRSSPHSARVALGRATRVLDVMAAKVGCLLGADPAGQGIPPFSYPAIALGEGKSDMQCLDSSTLCTPPAHSNRHRQRIVWNS